MVFSIFLELIHTTVNIPLTDLEALKAQAVSLGLVGYVGKFVLQQQAIEQEEHVADGREKMEKEESTT